MSRRRGFCRPLGSETTGDAVRGRKNDYPIAFILRARELDFSLDDVGEILFLRDQREAPCRVVLNLLEEKVKRMEAEIVTRTNLNCPNCGFVEELDIPLDY